MSGSGRHYLAPLLRPRSVAVVGASSRPDSVGGVVFRNLREGGFDGPVVAVNATGEQIEGTTVFTSIETIDTAVDLAVVATPAPTVPAIVEQCGRRGVKAAIVMAAGFREIGAEGRRLEERLLAAARGGDVRVLGPNCLGVMRPDRSLNATFGNTPAYAGNLALVSQSGALCTAILDWAAESGVGFSSVVSTGIGADVDFGEILDFLVWDESTRAILLYVEGINDARRFLSGLRAAARAKPIVVMKTGRHAAGSRAAVSHSGALVGDDDVFAAALARAGVVRVRDFADVFAAARILATGRAVAGERVAIVTNGGGPAVMATDRLADHGLAPAVLAEETLRALDAVLPAAWPRGNPVDVLGDADPTRYGRAVALCLADPGVDALLALLTPQAMTTPERVAQVTIDAVAGSPKPLLTCWMGERSMAGARALFRRAGVPTYETPEAAVEAFHALAAHHRNQTLLRQTPAPLAGGGEPDVAGARLIVDAVLDDGRQVLSEIESKAVLSAFRIPVARGMRAGSLGEAVVIAEELGFPVALKVHSPDITHKSDVGGVALDLGDVDALRRAWKRIEQTVAARRPEARLDGMVVEEMSRRRPGRELMIGVVRDPVFGPVVSVGIGGTAVEAIGDRSVMLPPLNRYLAGSMIEHTRAARLLGAFRGQAAACGGVVEDTLLRVSEMACELPTLVEMDLNPVIVDEDGIVVADARMVVARGVPQREPYAHMAVHPYPVDLVERLWLAGGEEVVLRPIRPEDAVIERDFVRALSAQSRYFRFMHALKELTPELLSRFTQIDYDREMALIAVVGAGGEEQQIGVARYVIMPDGETCEFAIVVADAWQGRGLGGAMMRALIAIARRKRLKRMQGQVLAANTAMLDFVRRLGFEVRPDPADATIALTTLDLWR